MSSSQFTSSIYLLTVALLLQTIFGASPLYHVCSSSQNFTSNGPYESNLKKLLSYLHYKTPPPGFGLGSVGKFDQYQIHGLALCRGDVNSTECKTCVNEASNEIHKRCPYNEGAVIWYDNCLLKYSNKDFFGQIDNESRFYLLNVRNVSEPEVFNQKARDLLSQLAKEASVVPKMYAVGEVELGEWTKLYGYAQCTRDLSSMNCFKCLEDAIGELPSCCDGKEGGRVVGGSCNIRYEIYPFFSA
ncbi:cysteine-rich repeat secretory protein 38-like [Juglans microcarpa x Juglans regia]|uniref:cysteine-rich repeat secretory protein 38-like n=1 Tax=Juglans microcarpa x Juglans regia TaxID=2249226 RepID=UPI001B7E7EC7|nr:cysteine-rich repeat secretory protein 38-like [Juglans microcarpa x Juglans regia]